MKRDELERALARQTGESLHCIRRLGFQFTPIKRPRLRRRYQHGLLPESVMTDLSLPAPELIEQFA